MGANNIQQYSHGHLNITLSDDDGTNPISISLPNCSFAHYALVAKQAYCLSESLPFHQSAWSSHSASLESADGLSFTEENSAEIMAGETMNDFSKDELHAHLKTNKAEVEAVAASMRREMAEWREQQNLQISQLTTAISTLSSKIDGKMDSIDGVVKSFDGKLEGIQGRIDGMGSAIGGINTAISGIQSGLSTKLTVFGIIITVLIALVGFGAAFYGKSSDAVQTQNPAPIVIQIPQQPNTIQAPTQTQK